MEGTLSAVVPDFASLKHCHGYNIEMFCSPFLLKVNSPREAMVGVAPHVKYDL